MWILWWASLLLHMGLLGGCGDEGLELSPQQISSSLTGVHFIDVREAAERRQDGWIPQSEWIPLDVLASRRDSLPPGPLVMVCTSGVRSLRAATYLRQHGGKQVFSLKGGMERWEREQGPMEHHRERWVGTGPTAQVGMLLAEVGAEVVVDQVLGGSPAARSGLKRGDVVKALENGEVGLEEISRRLEQVGSHMIQVERHKAPLTVRVEVEARPPRKIPPPGEIGPDGRCFLDKTTPRERESLRQAQVLSPVESRPGQPELVGSLRQDPSRVGGALLTRVKDLARSQTPAEELSRLLLLLGTQEPLPEGPHLRCEQSEPCLASVIMTLGRAVEAIHTLKRSLGPMEMRAANLNAFLVGWSREKTVEDVGDPMVRDGALSVIEMAPHLDVQSLAEATLLAASLLDPPFVDTLTRMATSLPPLTEIPAFFPATGELRLARWTPWGPMVIGGPGPNHYRGGFAFVLDLGGDDIYGEGVGATTGVMPVQVIIDRGGDDRWEGGSGSAQGAGILGVALIVDQGGNDTWHQQSRVDGRAPVLAQGAGYFGVGAVWDEGGDDTYQAGAWSQGVGLWGIGLLVDKEGVDHYQAGHFSQGAGGPGGVGVLREGAGSDHYHITGRPILAPEDTHHHWSAGQGVGMGVRRLYGGGTGILMDAAGDDTYVGGYYVQGSGWYLGLGLLYDGAGRDTYRAESFSQGAGIHQAVGALMDEGGDDTYLVDGHKTQGAGWDLGVGLLLDADGLDTAYAKDLAQGFGAHNGVGILVNGSGMQNSTKGTWSGGKTGTDSYGGGRGSGSIALVCPAQ